MGVAGDQETRLKDFTYIFCVQSLHGAEIVVVKLGGNFLLDTP